MREWRALEALDEGRRISDGERAAMDRRFVCSALVFVLCGALAAAAAAKPSPVRVLVAATVSDAAKGTMSPELWKRLVYAYVNADIVAFEGANPTAEDCHRAKAAYMVNATFDTVPRLPGMPQPKDRLSARTRMVATNCLTGTTMFDRVIPLTSNPITIANEGDLEPAPSVRWEKSVRDTLARTPLVLARVAQIVKVDGPFCFIDFPPGTEVAPGNTFRVFADKNSVKRSPILLTITDVSGKYAQCLFDAANGATPNTGDLVEPVTSSSS